MTEFSIRDFIDIEAEVVHEEEEEEDDEEDELAKFLNDDNEDSDTDWRRPRSLTPPDLRDEAAGLRAVAATRRAEQSPMPEIPEDVPQHFLLPAQGDPELWAVRVKHGFETDLVFQLARLCIQETHSRPPPAIASVFARPGIPGFIFIEGQPSDVTEAVRGLVTVYRQRRLVPPEERATLLSRRNPLSREIRMGDWVHCRHGLYRGDIGLVCERDESSEAELIVAFVPRVPDKPSSAKRKRSAHPEPRKWSVDRAKAVWGDKVRKISDEEYELKNETYKSGLILKHLPPAGVDASSGPIDIGPFILASYISSLPFYGSVGLRYAQDRIKVGDRVKIIDGEQQGLVGHTVDIIDSTVTVVLSTNDDPPIDISVRALSNLYLPGDHVKYRCADGRGIVSAVREETGTLTFVYYDTHEEITAPMYAVEPSSPPVNFFHFTPGLWVNFNGPNDFRRPKRRGYITGVEDAHAVVIDDRTFTEFKIDTRDLEVSPSQAPSPPDADLVHPWLGKRVVVIEGPRKGYFGVVRDLGNTAVTVELDALFAGAGSPRQQFVWHHLKPVSKEEEAARVNPAPRSHTPPPSSEDAPPRALTPEPEGSHWILNQSIQFLIERKTIPFNFRDLHEAGDELQVYANCTGRTLLLGSRTMRPKDGEVILSVRRHSRRKEISVRPKFLAPWAPVTGGEVVVVNGPWFGTVGIVMDKRDDGQWVVRFSVDDMYGDFVFTTKDLAAVE